MNSDKDENLEPKKSTRRPKSWQICQSQVIRPSILAVAPDPTAHKTPTDTALMSRERLAVASSRGKGTKLQQPPTEKVKLEGEQHES